MTGDRTKKSMSNMLMGFLYQFVTLVLGFVSRTAFIRSLGSEYLGLNGLFSDVLSLLSMADLGFGTAMAYSFYKPLAEGDNKKIASLVYFYKKIYNSIAIAVTVLGLGIIPFLKYIVNTEQEIPNLIFLYLLSLAGVVISYLFVYKTTLLTADQKDYKVVRIRLWTSLVKTVLQIIELIVLKDYIIYILIGIILQLINNVITTVKTEKEYPFLKRKDIASEIDENIKNDIFLNMKSVFIYKLSNTLFAATDNIIISVVVSTAAVGLYSNYFMVSNKLLLVVQIIFSALTASVGNIIAKENAHKKLEVFKSLQSISNIFSGIITTTFCVVANDLVRVWLGEQYVLDKFALVAISINTYFCVIMLPAWVYRDAAGLYVKTKYVMLTGAVINIILSVILGYRFGVGGVIIASIIARVSTDFWYEPMLLYKEWLKDGVDKHYKSIIFNLIIVVVSIVILNTLLKGIEVKSWTTLIIKGSMTGMISTLIFVLIYLKTPGMKFIFDKFRK